MGREGAHAGYIELNWRLHVGSGRVFSVNLAIESVYSTRLDNLDPFP